MSSLKKKARLMAGLALALIFLQPSLNAAEIASEETASGDAWRFRVFLDDREIGYHHFHVAQFGDTQQLRSVANFEYKLLFVKLFHYEHENLEIWSGDCLQSVESRTDANGTPFRVEGRREDGEFHVANGEGDVSLPDCIMSFAYWNPSFLEQGSLLNTQDGEYLEIEVSSPVFEELEVRGEQRPSYRYRLAAGALSLDLWYSTEREWLALESEVQGGRKLRYELL